MYRIEPASASLMESETVWLTLLRGMGLRVIESIRAWPILVAVLASVSKIPGAACDLPVMGYRLACS